MTTTLVVLHVLVMFTATVVSQGPAFLLWRAMRQRNVGAIQGLLDQYQGLTPIIGALFGVGVVIGLVTVFVGGYDPFAPWLVIAYALTLVAFVTPRLVTAPRMMRLAGAAATSPLDEPSPELREEISRATAPVFWIDALLLVLFIIDMVGKPFS